MKLAAKLIAERVPARPVGVVLVLHGGASRRTNTAVSPAQLSVLRMIPIAQRIAHAGAGQLAVFRLLNSVRGWDTEHTPVDDARWAMSQIADRLGERLPTCLVGHSLGGRAALLAADQAEVVSAVALAPWVYPTDSADLTGRRILIVHGDRDRVASPRHSAAVANTLAGTADVGYVLIHDGKHAMLRQHARFDGLAADFATATLLGRDIDGPVGQVLAGRRWLEV